MLISQLLEILYMILVSKKTQEKCKSTVGVMRQHRTAFKITDIKLQTQIDLQTKLQQQFFW